MHVSAEINPASSIAVSGQTSIWYDRSYRASLSPNPVETLRAFSVWLELSLQMAYCRFQVPSGDGWTDNAFIEEGGGYARRMDP